MDLTVRTLGSKVTIITYSACACTHKFVRSMWSSAIIFKQVSHPLTRWYADTCTWCFASVLNIAVLHVLCIAYSWQSQGSKSFPYRWFLGAVTVVLQSFLLLWHLHISRPCRYSIWSTKSGPLTLCFLSLVELDVCSNWFHAECTSNLPEDYGRLGEVYWVCDTCNYCY